MGILDRFRKDEIVGTRVLVCALDSRFNDLAVEDGAIYKHYYAATIAIEAATVNELLEYIARGYDIVHVLCTVSSSGIVAGSGISGTDIVDACCASGVKLLWIASDNDPNAYLTAFNVRRKRLNVVMTLQRKGKNFGNFLGQLLLRIAYGETMPIAWNDLCPQVPHASHGDVPDTIFVAGRGGVRLLK